MESLPKKIDPQSLEKRKMSDVERVENAWAYLNEHIKEGAVTVITLQTGPTAEGHKYHHAFAHRLNSGDIGLIGLSDEYTVNHAIGPNSKEGLQYRSDPSRPITSQIEPSFVAVVKQNGEIDGDVPAEYRDIQKVAKSFGFFYDSGVLGALKLPDSLAGPARQIDQQEKK